MNNICQKIAELSVKENVSIDIKFEPNYQLSYDFPLGENEVTSLVSKIEVFDYVRTKNHDYLFVCWDWSEESIMENIINIIRKIKEV